MSRGDLTQLNYSDKLVIPAMEAPVSYTLPFKWGNFNVTEAAHEAYELTPLTGKIVHGGGRDTNEPAYSDGLGVDIWLTGPDEFEAADREPSQLSGIKVANETYLHRQGIGLQIKFDKSRNVLKQGMAADIEAQTDGVGAEDLMAINSPFEEPVPLMEVIDKDISRLMVHGLVRFMSQDALNGLNQLQSVNDRYLTLSQTKQILIGGLAISGIELGLSFIDPALLPPIPAGIAVAIANNVWTMRLAYIRLKNHFMEAESREQIYGAIAQSRARLVSKDVHDTYCVDTFDANIEAAFGIDAPDVED